MTLMGVQYLNHQEQARHNLATEAETNRSNIATEKELNRSNLAREAEANRHNLKTETIENKRVEYQKAHNDALERLQHDSNANQLLRTMLDNVGSVTARRAARDLLSHLSAQGYNVEPGQANQLLKVVYDYQEEHPWEAFGQQATNLITGVWHELKDLIKIRL